MDQIKNESSGSVTFNAWLLLRDIFYLRSKFVLGGICRKKSIKSVIKSKIGLFLSNKERNDYDKDYYDRHGSLPK